MTTRRTAKSKGNQFEYSVRDSLLQKYKDVRLCKEEGYTYQYDIIVPSEKIFIECKRHFSFNWNELEKYFLKLEKRIKANKDDNGIYIPYLIFQGNHQPPLVMHFQDKFGLPLSLCVKTFGDLFEIPFLKHKGKKVKDASTD